VRLRGLNLVLLRSGRRPERAAGALIPLTGVLSVALLALIPRQPIDMFGADVLAAGAVIWLLDALMIVRSRPAALGHPSPTLWPRMD